MVDKEKRTNEIRLRLTDSEYLDFSRMAALRSREIADHAHLVARTYLYGHIATYLKGIFSTAGNEPQHTIEVTVSDADFINLSKIGVLKNKTITAVAEGFIKDSLSGHVARLNQAQALSNQAHRD